MTNTQRIIKYVAMAFAIFLVFSILSSIMFGIVSISNIFGDNDTNNNVLENLNINTNTLVLDIDVRSIDVIIKQGNDFKAETNNKYIKTRQNGNKLYIIEKNHSLFSKTEDSDLVVYVPSDYIFNAVAIENGAGKVDIDQLTSKKLYLDLGAGKVNIDNLLILNKAEIDGGAGSITIENGKINNLDLDMGIGKLSLTSELTGENEIDTGVSEVDLKLIGNINDYKIKLDKGIGSAKFDNEEMKSNTYYGNGSNNIDIDGGVGSIKIDFLDI